MAYGMYQRDLVDVNDLHNFAVFQNADRNHDGRLNPFEFAQGAAPYLGINPVQGRAVFQAADINHDGVLSREELNNIADFKRADLNHDGRVDPYEMQIYSGRSGLGYLPPSLSRPIGPVYGIPQNNRNAYNNTYTSSSYTRY